jgi:hypothetical protein
VFLYKEMGDKLSTYETRDAPDIRPDNPAFLISGRIPDSPAGFPVRPDTRLMLKKIHTKIDLVTRSCLQSVCSLDRNNTGTISSMFHTQYTPDFIVAEYYGLRNTTF